MFFFSNFDNTNENVIPSGGTPITMATKALTNFITGLDQSSKAVYGFIIGALGCIDFGGPISKVPNLICDGLLLEGITGPEAIKVLAAMVPPLGITFSLVLSKLLKKNIYTAMIADNVGTIIIGINASAHLGTFKLFLMNNAM